jgi:acyl transferase domain-containing protein
VIRAAVTNHGGKVSGLMVPNLNAQADLIKRAIQESGLPPEQITYLEGHGTGSELGDAIEVRALSKAFAAGTDKRGYCALASLKSNFGHLEGASGIAGLTKVLLQLQHGQIVPSLHSQQYNPLIDFGATPFRVPQQLEAWAQPRLPQDCEGAERPRAAGLGSFGAGGANAYVIIEEYVAKPPTAPRPGAAPATPAMVLLSAQTRAALRASAEALLAFLGEQPDTALEDLAYTLQVGRVPMAARLGMLASTIPELQQRLRDFLADRIVAPEICVGQAVDPPADNARRAPVAVDAEACGKLLQEFVAGADFEWEKLYEDGRARRIGLPVYPFARTKYWLTKALPVAPTAAERTSVSDVGDPVDQILGQVVGKTLSIDEATTLLSKRLSRSAGPLN